MSGINRLLSRRDRHTHGDHQKKPKQTAGHLYGLFPDEEPETPTKDDEAKLRALSRRLVHAGYTNFKEPDIGFVLNAPYAKGDPEKAYEILVLLEESESGIIKDYDPNIKLLGAVNREGVSCYLDSVLFAMFARLGNFEAILYHNFDNEPKRKLVTLLRLWVNTLRVGKLITTDITKQIQLQLAECGWKEAAMLSQQDASEAFSFITETLELPLLTLKMDIFHQGKEEESDDHKFINERLLEVAVPEDPKDGRLVTLEECLETYFNNRIEVKRYLERRNTLNSRKSLQSSSSFKGQSSEIDVYHVDTVEPQDLQNTNPLKFGEFNPTIQKSPDSHSKAKSIVREFFISEKNDVAEISPIEEEIDHQGRARAGSIRKQIMLPAWQFFNLVPWYTDNSASNDAQVAAHFASIRPVLGICLKRYSVLNRQPIRRDTRIDIPIDIGLPHFIQDDVLSEKGPAFGNFKLSLQSVVCHRGKSVDSGHYVSLVRCQEPAKNLPGEPPADIQSARERWMLLDDLASDRVTFVDVDEFLRKESPYLLFYQVQPIDEDSVTLKNKWVSPDVEGPPSYVESKNNGSAIIDPSLSTNASLESKKNLTTSNRPSTDISAFPQHSSRVSVMFERPRSMLATDTSIESGADDSQSNLAMNGDAADSRYLSASGDSRGRPVSRNPDKRLSRSLSRLTGKLKKEKFDDIPPTTANLTDGIGLEASDVTTAEVSRGDDQTRPKKESKDKRKHKSTSSRNLGLDGHHHHLVKAKKRSEKPERECSIM